MHQGKRWRMRVDDFALARGATEPITSKQTAERVWEPKFVGEIAAGGDPRLSPTKPTLATSVLTVGGFLDLYFASYVESEALRSAATIRGRLKAVKRILGESPIGVLEKSTEILRFKAAIGTDTRSRP